MRLVQIQWPFFLGVAVLASSVGCQKAQQAAPTQGSAQSETVLSITIDVFFRELQKDSEAWKAKYVGKKARLDAYYMSYDRDSITVCSRKMSVGYVSPSDLRQEAQQSALENCMIRLLKNGQEVPNSIQFNNTVSVVFVVRSALVMHVEGELVSIERK